MPNLFNRNHQQTNLEKGEIVATHKSAEKRARQNIKRRARNRSIRANLRTELKKFLALITENKLDEAKKALPGVHKVIDKAQTKGVLKKETASRNKSRMTTRLNLAIG